MKLTAEKQNWERANYFLTLISVIATIISFLKPQYQILLLVLGIIGIAFAGVYSKIIEYMQKIDKNEIEIRNIKKEIDYYKKHMELKTEIEIIKSNIRGKKAQQLAEVAMIILIVLILFFIGKAFGWW